MSCDIKSYYGYLDQQNAQNSAKNVSVFVAVFLYAVTMLIFQIERIISGERHGLTTPFLFFFLKMSKIWVGRTTLNGEKKREWHKRKLKSNFDRPSSIFFANFITFFNLPVTNNS